MSTLFLQAIPLRKERDSGFLCRDVTECGTIPAGLAFLREGEDKLSGEPLVPAICMWSPQVWLMGWFAACKERVEVNLNPQHGNTPACPVSGEQVGCTVAKAVPAGKVCWPQRCRLEQNVAQVLLKQIELPCPCNSVEHTRGLTLRFP